MKGTTKLLELEDFELTIVDFLERFVEDVEHYLRHDFSFKASATARKDFVQNIPPTHAAILVDYSAKYVLEVYEQTQVDNFQKTKISVFVAVVGTCKKVGGAVGWRTHLYVGQELNQTIGHVATALTHLFTSLKDPKNLKQNPVEQFHVFSDGANHFKCNEMLSFLRDSHYKFHIQWNFFATGHGKSLCDIEGYNAKRTVTNYLRSTEKYDIGTRGITDGKTFAEYLSDNVAFCKDTQVQDPKLKDKNSVVSRTVTYMGALKAYKFKVGDKFHLDGIRDRIYSFTNQFKVCKRPSVGVRSRACYCPSCHRGEFSSCESPGSCAFISVPEASKSVRDDKRQCFTCKAKGHTWRNCPRDIEVSSDDSGASDSDAPLASDCSDDEH